MKTIRINTVTAMTPDVTLVRTALAGDEKAFNSLVKRYQQSVYALVWSVVHHSTIAEDITQDVFIAAYSRLSDLRTPGSFAAWLRRIAINTARMWLRTQFNREISSDMDQFVDSKPTEQESLRQEIAEALVSLTERQREVVLLCYMDGVSRHDAARFLGLNEGTLRKRLHDAKRMLQKRIVEATERNVKEYLLPKGFERRCICACKRAIEARRKEVSKMSAQKKCLCGCLPPTGKKKVKGQDANKIKSGKKKPGKNSR